MTETEPNRYFSRMARVPEIGKTGLQKLQSAKVTVVGVGGVGSSICYYLAQSGIGQLKLIDQDIVEPSNLHRLQGLDKSHVYHPKAEALADSLQRLVPSSRFEAVVDTLRSANLNELLGGADVIVDGLDNFRTRYILNRHSVRTSTPYIFTSAVQNQGHVGVFSPPETACLECRFDGVVDGPQDSCDALGVTPVITGLIGAVAAGETVKIILAMSSNALGRLMTIDTATSDFILTSIAKREGCRTCGPLEVHDEESKAETLAELCGGKTFNVISRLNDIDLVRAASFVPEGSILTSTRSVLVFRKGNVTISLFKSGRVLVNGVEDREEALRIAGYAASLGAKPVSAIPS
jgi:molybdopterin-synthase adenylyltransferase